MYDKIHYNKKKIKLKKNGMVNHLHLFGSKNIFAKQLSLSS